MMRIAAFLMGMAMATAASAQDRFPELKPEQMTPAQKQVADARGVDGVALEGVLAEELGRAVRKLRRLEHHQHRCLLRRRGHLSLGDRYRT